MKKHFLYHLRLVCSVFFITDNSKFGCLNFKIFPEQSPGLNAFSLIPLKTKDLPERKLSRSKIDAHLWLMPSFKIPTFGYINTLSFFLLLQS